jgi:hypothetical protein
MIDVPGNRRADIAITASETGPSRDGRGLKEIGPAGASAAQALPGIVGPPRRHWGMP